MGRKQPHRGSEVEHDRAPAPTAELERAPSLAPAIVSGSCAVLVALITGAFNWVNRGGYDAPEPTPTLAVSRGHEVRTALLDPAGDARPTPTDGGGEPNYGLNFAAFQSVVKDKSMAPEVRQRALDRCLGHVVMWQGYVSAVTPNDAAATGFTATVSLVESPDLVEQSLFTTPALCRFASDLDGRALALQPGQRVTISGDCDSHTAIGTELRNCRLCTVEDESATRVAEGAPAEPITR